MDSNTTATTVSGGRSVSESDAQGTGESHSHSTHS